jgi:putative MFS transporter
MQDLPTTLDAALTRIGTGRFQRRLLGIFGLVWAADAMQVLAVGFTAPSLAAQFGPGAPALLGTVFFVGMAIGAPLFGRIADRHGRRNVLIGTVMLDAVFGLVAYGAPQYWLLILARFITGLAVGGTLPVDYAMMAEFLPSAKRGRWLVGLEAFWAVGTLVLSIGAFAAAAYDPANAWRWILLLTAMPALIGFWLRLWIPESPLYLAATGRLREAHQVVDMIAVTNGAPPLGTAIRFEAAPRLPLSALFAPGLARTTVLMLAIWFLVSVSYYGLFTWLPAQLARQEGLGFIRGQGFLILLALAQLPGYALAAYGVERWGRRPTLTGFLIFAALGCATYVAASDPNVLAGAQLAMSFALLGAWGALYAFTPELYPTALRGSGMGAAGAAARIGGIAAPTVIGAVVAVSWTLTIGVFAGLLALAAVAAIALGRETKGAALD